MQLCESLKHSVGDIKDVMNVLIQPIRCGECQNHEDDHIHLNIQTILVQLLGVGLKALQLDLSM